MHAIHSFLLAILLTLAGTGTASSRAAEPEKKPLVEPPQMRLLVPAYFYPAEQGLKEWNRLIAASARVPIVAIVNPASGPGKQADPNYVKLLKRAGEAKKLTLIGYVATSYGKRPLQEVQADVDRWLRLYPGIHGIFFDEQASGADGVKYQAALYRYVRSKPALKLVITNPGTVCAEQYLSEPAADGSCLFEAAKLFDLAALPQWTAKYPGRVAVLSYKVGDVAAMKQAIQSAVEKKIGYCYVTDAEGANPWSRLPKYWDEEVAAAMRPAK
jgi:hypothetical protein